MQGSNGHHEAARLATDKIMIARVYSSASACQASKQTVVTEDKSYKCKRWIHVLLRAAMAIMRQQGKFVTDAKLNPIENTALHLHARPALKCLNRTSPTNEEDGSMC